MLNRRACVFRRLITQVETIGRTDLISHAQILRIGHLILIHFDRRRSRTLRLVRNLNLSLAYLDRVGIVGSGVLTSHLFFVWD